MNKILRTNIFMIGFCSNGLSGSKLPSNREVLKVLFFNMRVVKLNLRESARLTIQEVVIFWEKARIPFREHYHCIKKLEMLYEEWRDVQKHHSRKNKKSQQRETDFKEKLDNLFDLAHARALELIAIEEDKKFLLSQRKEGRPGYMYGIDHELDRKEDKLEKEKQIRLRRMQRSIQQIKEMDPVPMLLTSDSQDSSGTEEEDLEVFPVEMEAVPQPRKKARGTVDIITPKLAIVLDACKISDRNAVRVIAATVESMGNNVQNFILNKQSIRIARQKQRTERGNFLKKQFNVSDLSTVCLHWDGKLLPALEGREIVDRLPILISSGAVEQLLEVPALEKSTGRGQAMAICKSVFEWGLQDHLNALVFDTTAVNTGRLNGTCSIIENMLEKNLLYLPCRHHIFELILKSAFNVKMIKSDSPNVKMFQKFQSFWPQINKNNYSFGIAHKNVRKALKEDNVERITCFLNKVIEEKQPREDYRELLELALIFLGKKPHYGIKFRSPGAMHHARWMAKAIYTLKIFLFRHEFKLTAKEENNLVDVSIFIVKIYCEVWFSASSPVKAPFLDFNFLSSLHQYRLIDSDISQVTMMKFCKHLWYLSPEVIGLALFDNNVPVDTKKRMVKNLNRDFDDDLYAKRVSIDSTKIPEILENGIEQFVYKNSKEIFHRFKLNEDFLETDPSTWPEQKSYVEAQKTLLGLKVVNDTAERAVKLMQDYNSILSRDEQQKQYILQTVTNYRHRFPNCNKDSLLLEL